MRLVDDDGQALADLPGQPGRRNLLLALHETVPAGFLDLLRHLFEPELVGARSLDRLVLEAAGPVDPGFVEPVEQHLEIFLRLAGEADDEGGAHGKVRAGLAPGMQSLQRLFAMGRAAHVLQHLRRGVLEGDVQIGKDAALGHQRDDLRDMRVGVDVVEAHPQAELAQFLGQVEELGAHLALLPDAGLVPDVDAVGAGVLRDDEQFLDAGLGQLFSLAQHVDHRPRDEVAAQGGDDAEGAAVVAAFGDLQIGVVARGQLHALRRQKVDIGVVRRGCRLVNRRHDALIGLRAGDGEHVGVLFADEVRGRAHAAGDDDLAVLLQRRADGAQRFLAGRIEEAAGVDHDQVGTVVLAGDLVAFRAQPRDDALRIDERLRASEADEADAGSWHRGCSGGFGRRRSITLPAPCLPLRALR